MQKLALCVKKHICSHENCLAPATSSLDEVTEGKGRRYHGGVAPGAGGGVASPSLLN